MGKPQKEVEFLLTKTQELELRLKDAEKVIEFYAKSNTIPKHIADEGCFCTIRYCEDGGKCAKEYFEKYNKGAENE